MFEAQANATATEFGAMASDRDADFRTPDDPEAGWASRNPDRALVFLYMSPRRCGALEELMAL